VHILEELKKKLSDNNQDTQVVFYEVSKKIMNNYTLKISDKEIELCEIEFYYFDCKNHSDPYVHIDDLQKNTFNKLYIHKQPWNRGGIDITFGNNEYYGGILIRGIKYNNEYISGSATVKDYIANLISNNHSKKYKDLQNECDNLNAHLFKQNKELNNIVYLSTRIGLNNNKNENFAKFLYRFVREDYLYADNDTNFKSYKNLKDRSKLKAILDLIGTKQSNEKSTKQNIEQDNILSTNINKIKKI